MAGFSVPWSFRAGARIGHYAVPLLVVAIVGAVTVGLYPPPPPFTFTVPLALFMLVLGIWALMRQHDRSLCEQCVHDLPLNPSAEAKRLHRRFWMAHTGSEPRFLIPYLAVLLGSNFAMSTVGRIGWALIQLTMIYLVLAQSTHRRLQPWCPWCSDGGGGSHVDDDTPVLPQDDREPV